MRLAAIATGVAAIAAAPLIGDMQSPSMSQEQFLAAVRCAAYEDVALRDADTGALKMHLNAEARRQSEAAVRQADVEVGIIAREARSAALSGKGDQFHEAFSHSCGVLTAGGAARDAAG